VPLWVASVIFKNLVIVSQMVMATVIVHNTQDITRMVIISDNLTFVKKILVIWVFADILIQPVRCNAFYGYRKYWEQVIHTLLAVGAPEMERFFFAFIFYVLCVVPNPDFSPDWRALACSLNPQGILFSRKYTRLFHSFTKSLVNPNLARSSRPSVKNPG